VDDSFDGLIDEVILFHRALTAAEIQAIYDAGSAGMCPPPGCIHLVGEPMSWWTGDGTARDLVGFADGVLQGGATYAPGLVGQAFSLNGTNAYVLIPTIALWMRGSWTMSMITASSPFRIRSLMRLGQDL
jgi:hypothetical protein